jgi:hypothetical protein
MHVCMHSRHHKLPLICPTPTQVAATYEGEGAPELPPPESQTTAVVRARVTAAKCVERVVAAAKAELAHLAAQAETQARLRAKEAENGAVSTSRPGKESPREPPGPLLGDTAGVSHEDAAPPELPSSSGDESSQVRANHCNAWLGQAGVSGMSSCSVLNRMRRSLLPSGGSCWAARRQKYRQRPRQGPRRSRPRRRIG